MMMSPDSIIPVIWLTYCSVASPAGTMIQTTRGFFILDIKSWTEVAPVAPSLASP